jgi:N-acyl-L-homoserine lactone synthetase
VEPQYWYRERQFAKTGGGGGELSSSKSVVTNGMRMNASEIWESSRTLQGRASNLEAEREGMDVVMFDKCIEYCCLLLLQQIKAITDVMIQKLRWVQQQATS